MRKITLLALILDKNWSYQLIDKFRLSKIRYKYLSEWSDLKIYNPLSGEFEANEIVWPSGIEGCIVIREKEERERLFSFERKCNMRLDILIENNNDNVLFNDVFLDKDLFTKGSFDFMCLRRICL